MNIQGEKKDLLAEEWIKKAKDDELNASSILKHRDGTPSGVCLLSHQMAEKYFKAYLVLKKGSYPKIHFLDKLTEISMKIDHSFIELKEEVALLDPFYTPTRYPGDYSDFLWDDAEKAFRATLRIKEFILDKII
ncbi:HEPN domain-containing protein [Candidatus Wolfebacteria bacterium]|nr:HEPN domain-containing protein [Candidatus Wolfebacteria bacterium]